MTSDAVKLGALCWNQYTDWPSLREAGIRADQLGFDSLWTWDHLYPIVGDHEGPMFEAWLTLAAWAALTEHATIGLMVGANTFRNPALVAKLATTLDHISGGRAVLGIGGAWFETEHRDLGIEFGGSPGERLRWLEEAVQIMRGMLHGERPSGMRYYRARDALNLPAPLQEHLPLVIGGGGERRTLRIVARYADACNVFGAPDMLRHKFSVLAEHCADVGRDYNTIERTNLSSVSITPDGKQGSLTPAGLVERLGNWADAGTHHTIFSVRNVWDLSKIELIGRDVIPQVRGLGEPSPLDPLGLGNTPREYSTTLLGLT